MLGEYHIEHRPDSLVASGSRYGAFPYFDDFSSFRWMVGIILPHWMRFAHYFEYAEVHLGGLGVSLVPWGLQKRASLRSFQMIHR